MRNHLPIIYVECILQMSVPFSSLILKSYAPYGSLNLLLYVVHILPSLFALPVFLNGGLPIRSAAGFPSRNLENSLYTKTK